MSTILKALRRLEGDRSVQEQRPLRETVASGGAPAPGARRRSRLGWLLALVLMLGAGAGAGVLAFWSVAGRQAAEPPPQTAALAPGAVEPTVVRVAPDHPPAAVIADVDESPAPVAESPDVDLEVEGELSAAALTSPVERIERAPAGPRIDDTAEPERLEPLAAEPPTVRGQPLVPAAQLPGRHQREAQAPVLAAATPRPEPVAEPEPPTATPPPPEPVRASPESRPAPAPTPEEAPAGTSLPVAGTPAEPAPVAAERPAEKAPEAAPPGVASSEPASPPAEPAVARADVPSLWVARTSWHPSAERRTAMVQVDAGETVEVREGDAIGLLVVARIEPSSVVFLHEGVEIRRRVGQR